LARSSHASIERLMTIARRLGRGDLSARVGLLAAEPELATLAATLDDMAGRLSASIAHERAVEAMRRDMFTAISHDLRTPLSSIKAISEALEHGVIHEPGEVRRYLGEMCAAVDLLVKMTGDLFELVQTQEDKVAPGSGAAFGAVLGSAVGACEVLAREKGIAVRTDLDGTSETVCSPGLERVLQNLLVNAIRHSEDGEVV